jgi:NhaA family Na+:H+ antiporter
MRSITTRTFSTFRDLLHRETAGGLVLIVAASTGLLLANSPVAAQYFAALHVKIGPLTLIHWINDGLMAVFFLLVGLEIKRELLDGQLATWRRRVLPGLCAAGGMIGPSIIFVAINWGRPENLVGWAIPAATDIAFALGVLTLLGRRVPASLKVFLTALAIVDDLGAIVLIGMFYGQALSGLLLALAGVILAALVLLNRAGVSRLAPYVLIGSILWVVVLNSGLHATTAGVALALCIPLKTTPGRPDDLVGSPLHRLEHSIQAFVGLVVLPIFGLANAGVSLATFSHGDLFQPLTAGIILGLLAGKLIGVFGTAAIAIRLGIAERPSDAGLLQLLGVSVLCGIGFTMSLFIGSLAFDVGGPQLAASKVGVVVGSVTAAVVGWTILRFAPPKQRR